MNIELSIWSVLLETKRHLNIDFLIISKSSIREGRSDIGLLEFQAKWSSWG